LVLDLYPHPVDLSSEESDAHATTKIGDIKDLGSTVKCIN